MIQDLKTVGETSSIGSFKLPQCFKGCQVGKQGSYS